MELFKSLAFSSVTTEEKHLYKKTSIPSESDSEMKAAPTMSLTSATGFLVLLSVTVVQGKNGWRVTYSSTQICAFKGSTVTMRCSYTYPNWINKQKTTVKETFWFIKTNNDPVDLKKKSNYKGRVLYRCDHKSCSVTISDLRLSDSAQYKFRFITNQPDGHYTGSPGVILTVTERPDLQVHVTRPSSCRSSKCVQVKLRCQSRCHLPDRYKYTWIKNKNRIHSETSSSYSTYFSSEDTVSCAVEGYETFSSPPVFAPKVPSVSFSPSGEITEGSSVTLSCTSVANPPVTKYTWYKRGNNPLQPRGEGQQFLLSFINSSDSGSYSCQAENGLGLKMSEYVYIDVKYAPRRPSVSVSPSGQLVEGSSVTLTCTSDANPPVTEYTWYKEDEDSPTASGQNFTITDSRSKDSGNYYCEAQNSRGRQNSTSHLIVVSSSWKSVAAGVTVAVLLPIILILVFFLIRRMRALTTSSEPEDRPNNSQQCPSNQRHLEEQDNLHYATVNFCQNKEDPVYSNTGPARRPRDKKEPTFTEYSPLTFHNNSKEQRGRVQETAEDSAVLYSTVNKTKGPRTLDPK